VVWLGGVPCERIVQRTDCAILFAMSRQAPRHKDSGRDHQCEQH
jgi:hypothetical protein